MAVPPSPAEVRPKKSPAGKRPTTTLTILSALVVLAFLAHVNVGSYQWYTPWEVLRDVLRGPGGEGSNFVVWQLRMPRAVACVLVGGTLGVVGSAFQAQFRNPLTDPYIVGVSSGAAIGGVIALITGLDAAMAGLGTPALGFVFGMISLALVMGVARRRGVVDVSSVLLGGVVIGSFLSAMLSLALLASGQSSNMVLGWLLGNMTDILWNKVYVLFGAFAVGTALLMRETRRLNALALGEDAAARLGVDVGRLRTVVLTVGTAMTAAAVGTVGIVGFLGLVAPHIARRVVGVDWRYSLAGSGLVGALILVVADLIAQRGLSLLTKTPGMEIPVGVVTALLGAPTLLVLLRRERG